MASILKRNLITLFFLFGSISLANAQSGAQPETTVNAGTSGWTFVQDSIATACHPPLTSCVFASGDMLPTTAGSVWIVRAKTANNTTISSVTGGGGTWTLCPNCHIFSGTNQSFTGAAQSMDAAYNLSGTGGTTSITVNLSGSSGTASQIHFIELLPPPGSTASFDTAGTTTSTSCTTCAAVGLTLSGTDAVFQTYAGNGTQSWNSWSSPYTTDGQGYGIGLNVTSGTAPTVAMTNGTTGAIFMALAFKSSLGSFAPPSAQFSLVNYTHGGLNCAPTCSLSIPSTGSGHLLYIEAANTINSRILSVSGGGTWTIPSGANSCAISFVLLGNNMLSCGYALSSIAGTTSLNITMSGSGTENFAVSEVSTASGSFVLDTQGSTLNVPFSSGAVPGQPLALTGTNDVIFQSIFCPGGISSVTFYPQPYIDGQGTQFYNNQAAQATLLNTASGAPPFWADAQRQGTIVSGMAFKVVGGSTLPNPPTGLTVVVH